MDQEHLQVRVEQVPVEEQQEHLEPLKQVRLLVSVHPPEEEVRCPEETWSRHLVVPPPPRFRWVLRLGSRVGSVVRLRSEWFRGREVPCPDQEEVL